MVKQPTPHPPLSASSLVLSGGVHSTEAISHTNIFPFRPRPLRSSSAGDGLLAVGGRRSVPRLPGAPRLLRPRWLRPVRLPAPLRRLHGRPGLHRLLYLLYHFWALLASVLLLGNVWAVGNSSKCASVQSRVE
jgi:hypothetical protein